MLVFNEVFWERIEGLLYNGNNDPLYSAQYIVSRYLKSVILKINQMINILFTLAVSNLSCW